MQKESNHHPQHDPQHATQKNNHYFIWLNRYIGCFHSAILSEYSYTLHFRAHVLIEFVSLLQPSQLRNKWIIRNTRLQCFYFRGNRFGTAHVGQTPIHDRRELLDRLPLHKRRLNKIQSLGDGQSFLELSNSVRTTFLGTLLENIYLLTHVSCFHV